MKQVFHIIITLAMALILFPGCNSKTLRLTYAYSTELGEVQLGEKQLKVHVSNFATEKGDSVKFYLCYKPYDSDVLLFAEDQCCLNPGEKIKLKLKKPKIWEANLVEFSPSPTGMIVLSFHDQIDFVLWNSGYYKVKTVSKCLGYSIANFRIDGRSPCGPERNEL